MLGYFDDQIATEKAFNARRLVHDRRSRLDRCAGYLRIAGRSKDMIMRGGHNIHPAQVEALGDAALGGAARGRGSDE